MRGTRFDEERREEYLEALRETANHARSAYRAGVHPNTAKNARLADPAFAAEAEQAHADGCFRVLHERLDREFDRLDEAREQGRPIPMSPWLEGTLKRLARRRDTEGADLPDGETAEQP